MNIYFKNKINGLNMIRIITNLGGGGEQTIFCLPTNFYRFIF